MNTLEIEDLKNRLAHSVSAGSVCVLSRKEHQYMLRLFENRNSETIQFVVPNVPSNTINLDSSNHTAHL